MQRTVYDTGILSSGSWVKHKGFRTFRDCGQAWGGHGWDPLGEKNGVGLAERNS